MYFLIISLVDLDKNCNTKEVKFCFIEVQFLQMLLSLATYNIITNARILNRNSGGRSVRRNQREGSTRKGEGERKDHMEEEPRVWNVAGVE